MFGTFNFTAPLVDTALAAVNFSADVAVALRALARLSLFAPEAHSRFGHYHHLDCGCCAGDGGSDHCLERDERVWLYVDDDGPGVPHHLRDDVFKPFTRLDEARNLDHSGSGLGLAIALDIAHAHGGDIVLEDSKLGGLRVAVKVPI